MKLTSHITFCCCFRNFEGYDSAHLTTLLKIRTSGVKMKTIREKSAALCNFEVMEKLKKIRSAKTMKKGELATITYETLCYLEGTPCKQMTDLSVRKCLRELKSILVLTDLERLMLVNTPPVNAVELQLIVRDSEERLTEEEVDKILEIVSRNFPHIKEIKKDSDNDSE